MIQELEQDNLAQIVASNKKIAVQYSAGWCGNCRIMKPKFKKFAEDMSDIDFYIVDAERLPESRKLAQVDNLPTFAIFNEGTLIAQTQTNQTDVLKTFLETN